MKTAQKQKVHFVHQDIINPPNPITLNILGAGGTGSHLTKAVAIGNFALNALGHCGFHVNQFDPESIESPNIGRTTFNQNEIGLNKAVCAINSVNREYGTNWKAIPCKYELNNSLVSPENMIADITLSCVDDVKARFDIAQILNEQARVANYHSRNRPLYWIDFGNSRYSGQIMISTIGKIYQPVSNKFETVDYLPSIIEEYRDLLLLSAKSDNLPSCSFVESDQKQDIFINQILANYGGSILRNMIKFGSLTHRGLFLNLETCRTEPINL